MAGPDALYVFGDLHYVSAKTMKIIHTIIAIACLALALVGLVIGCLLGQPVTLFKEDDKL